MGCRIAASIAKDAGSEQNSGDAKNSSAAHNRAAITKLGLAIFFTLNVMVFTMVLWTWNVHELPENASVLAFRDVLRYACFLFAAPVLILLIGPLLDSSRQAIHQRKITTDILLLIGVVAAFSYSVFSLMAGYADVYFEVACMILVAVTLGKWFEATAKYKVNQSLKSLRKLLPETVRLVTANDETIVPLNQVRKGNRLSVLPGERIPVDGTLLRGICSVDEQIVTGESLPASRSCGDTVFGGTLNLTGPIVIEASSSSSDGVISRLADSVQQAMLAKCDCTRLADSIATIFVPVIFVASILAFLVNSSDGLQVAAMSSLSVVLIACPCAMGIATPLALWVGLNAASEKGVLFKNGDALIQLANIRSIAFDKTGTLTIAQPRVTKELYCDPDHTNGSLNLALTLASSSNHVLAKGIARELSGRDDLRKLDDLQSIQDRPGKGVVAFADSRLVMLGSMQLAEELNFKWPVKLRDCIQEYSEGSVVCVGSNQLIDAVFLIGESVRPETEGVIHALKEGGLDLVVLTGDRSLRADAISKKLGITTFGQLLPNQKTQKLLGLRRPVAMVGDGINDAPALASADVGVALDCGADLSRNAADVCLLGNSLQQLPWAIQLAKKTQSTIRSNLVWAIGYNLIGMGLAIFGCLNPIIAAIAMVGSSLFVITNSLRLGLHASAKSPATEPRRFASSQHLIPRSETCTSFL